MATKRLGKGLQALIPDIPDEPGDQRESLRDIEVSRISANPFQPRSAIDPASLEELKQSISSNGLITPITVRRHGDGYQLIAGERRLRAVQELGYQTIPVYVVEVNQDAQMLELALIENVQREDLNPIEEARGYQRLLEDCHLTQEEIARKVGKDRATIANSLRLLKLDDRLKESLQKGEMSAGHARALLSVADQRRQIELWKKVVKQQLNVRQAEKLAKSASPDKKAGKKRKPAVPFEIQQAEDSLRRIFGTQARILKKGKAGGVIELEFYSDSDLERLLELMQRI